MFLAYASASEMDSATSTPKLCTNILSLTAKRKVEGIRLDQYLAGMFQDYSRSVIQKVIDAGGVAVNGSAAKASYKVRNGDEITIRLPESTHDAPVAEDIPLTVLYEDEFLAIINKPHDMVVHPAKGHWSGTLVNALRFTSTSSAASTATTGPALCIASTATPAASFSWPRTSRYTAT